MHVPVCSSGVIVCVFDHLGEQRTFMQTATQRSLIAMASRPTSLELAGLPPFQAVSIDKE